VVHSTAKRPFTGWSLSGRELAERGAETLADALNLLPNVINWLGGRGQIRFSFRAARPGTIRVLIDGVPMEDPYMQQFDPASIPVTDVVEIVITPSLQSPIDGPGGEGGVVEVTTLVGSGRALLNATARAGYPTDGLASVTARQPVDEQGGVRVSGTFRGTAGDYDVRQPNGSITPFSAPSTLGQAGLRFDQTVSSFHLTADFAAYDRCYWVTPSQAISMLDHVCSEEALRGIVRGELNAGAWRLTMSAFGMALGSSSDFYANPQSLQAPQSSQVLRAHRLGGKLDLEWLPLPSLRFIAGAVVLGDVAMFEQTKTPSASGRDLTAEPAVAAVYQAGVFQGELSLGEAIPLTPGVAPWPEGKGTLVVRLPWAITLTGNVGRKGGMPTLQERYDPYSGNPDLGPERHTYADLSVYYRNPWFSPQLVVYRRWLEGLIQQDPTTSHYVNVAAVDANGLEASFEVNPTGMLQGGASYGYLTSTTPINNQPANHGEIYAKLQLPRLGAFVRYRYVGSRLQSGNMLDPYTLVDVSAWYRINRWLRATVRCDDLLDVHYQYQKNLLSSGRWIGLTLDFTLQ
jgi:outer membrane cobalamin receptor